MEPLVFAILNALTPAEHICNLYDERLEPIPESLDCDLVALSVETYTARRSYQIARQARRQGIPVVMGGYHPSFFPSEALSYADAIVVGDAEAVWTDVLKDAQRGRLQPIYRGRRLDSLAGLPSDRSIFRGKRYKRLVPIQFGRGCRFACDFCSIHAFYGTEVRTRPVADVVAELVTLGERYILFVDDNLFVDAARARELFSALRPLNIRWACQTSIDIAQDDQLLDLMAESGCFMALIGFESLSAENLRSMKKKWNLRGGDYNTAIRRFKERAIGIYASFVFGYDDDRGDCFDRTAEFALEAGVALAHFNTLTPMPGSGLYAQLVKEQRLIFPRWWLDPRYSYGQATFIPKHMSPDELTDGCRRARFTFYKYSEIARRTFSFLLSTGSIADALMLAGVNIVSRRELQSKLGRPLGSAEALESKLINDVPLSLELTDGHGVHKARVAL